MSTQRAWRRVFAMDLGLFNLGVLFLALIPPSTLILPEVVFVVLALMCFAGVISHASERWHLPGDRWSYLLTGWLAATAFLVFESVATEEVPAVFRVSTGLFLLAGAASAYAAHVIDGGRSPDDRAGDDCN